MDRNRSRFIRPTLYADYQSSLRTSMSTRATATPNSVHSSCCDNLNSLPSLPPPIPGYRPSKPRAISTKTPSKLGKYMPAPTFFFNSSAFSYSSGDLLKESPRRQSVQVPIESATKLLEDYANYKKSQSKQSVRQAKKKCVKEVAVEISVEREANGVVVNVEVASGRQEAGEKTEDDAVSERDLAMGMFLVQGLSGICLNIQNGFIF